MRKPIPCRGSGLNYENVQSIAMEKFRSNIYGHTSEPIIAKHDVPL